jgi:hypothetical protein
MPYAIMQKELDPPDVDRVKRAFRALPTLRDLDAQTAANDAYGIFLRGLDVEAASYLQDALVREGVAAIVVAESDLPQLPPAKLVRQVELLPDHLMMYDPMRRAFTVPWRDIMLLAAGNVRLPEARGNRPAYEPPPARGTGVAFDTIGEVRVKDLARYRLMLELVLGGGVARYSITADEFSFAHLGDRFTRSLTENFSLLVQDLAQHAPHAGLNRGACSACQKADSIFSYPGKAAFFEEVTWMLWRIAQAGRGDGI